MTRSLIWSLLLGSINLGRKTNFFLIKMSAVFVCANRLILSFSAVIPFTRIAYSSASGGNTNASFAGERSWIFSNFTAENVSKGTSNYFTMSWSLLIKTAKTIISVNIAPEPRSCRKYQSSISDLFSSSILSKVKMSEISFGAFKAVLSDSFLDGHGFEVHQIYLQLSLGALFAGQFQLCYFHASADGTFLLLPPPLEEALWMEQVSALQFQVGAFPKAYNTVVLSFMFPVWVGPLDFLKQVGLGHLRVGTFDLYLSSIELGVLRGTHIDSYLSASCALVVNDSGNHGKTHDGGNCHDYYEEDFEDVGCGCIFVSIWGTLADLVEVASLPGVVGAAWGQATSEECWLKDEGVAVLTTLAPDVTGRTLAAIFEGEGAVVGRIRNLDGLVGVAGVGRGDEKQEEQSGQHLNYNC